MILYLFGLSMSVYLREKPCNPIGHSENIGFISRVIMIFHIYMYIYEFLLIMYTHRKTMKNSLNLEQTISM